MKQLTTESINEAVHMANALQALRLKRGQRLRSTRDGIEIVSPGKPTLLLTNAAAVEFSHQMQEVDYG